MHSVTPGVKKVFVFLAERNKEAIPWHTGSDLPRSFPADHRFCLQQGSHPTRCISFLRPADRHVTYTNTQTQTKLTDDVLVAVRDVQKMFALVYNERPGHSQTERLHVSSLCYKAAKSNQQPSESCSIDPNIPRWGQEGASSHTVKGLSSSSQVSIFETSLTKCSNH